MFVLSLKFVIIVDYVSAYIYSCISITVYNINGIGEMQTDYMYQEKKVIEDSPALKTRSIGWLGCMAYQPLQPGYCQIHLYTNNQFYFKQFSLT